LLLTQTVAANRASAVDEAVSNITAALKSSGLWQTTLLVWSSDNVRSPSERS